MELNAEWSGRVVRLSLSNPSFDGREALVSCYNDAKDRLVVWVLPTAEEILVKMQATHLARLHTKESCRRPVWRTNQRAPSHGAVAEDVCSICLDEPRDPVVLPCCHRFCTACLTQMHQQSTGPSGDRCPNCRARIPGLFGSLINAALDLLNKLREAVRCADPRCRESPNPATQHEIGPGYGCLLAPTAIDYLNERAELAKREKDFRPLLDAIETTFAQLREVATEGHRLASKVAEHRRLMRVAVCSLHEDVRSLRRMHEGSVTLQTLCGGFDGKIEALHRRVYGRPMASRAEQEAKRASHGGSLFTGIALTEEDNTMTAESMGLVIGEFEASWLYVRSFGFHYDRMLHAFANVSAEPRICRDAVLGPVHRKRLADLGVVEWVMSRLDAMEDMMRDSAPGGDTSPYGSRESSEVGSLLNLLFNACFASGGAASGDAAAADRFLRGFGQEYLLRERAGALEPALRRAAAEMLQDASGVVGEQGEPLLLLRPCAAARAGLAMQGECRFKESREAEFSACACGRAAYCGAMCRMRHSLLHADCCVFAQRAQQRNRQNDVPKPAPAAVAQQEAERKAKQEEEAETTRLRQRAVRAAAALEAREAAAEATATSVASEAAASRAREAADEAVAAAAAAAEVAAVAAEAALAAAANADALERAVDGGEGGSSGVAGPHQASKAALAVAKCAGCQADRPTTDFSAAQMKKKGKRQCHSCIAAKELD